ncbi:EF-hand domain-containing protein [Saccharothrix longispora]|uniref:Ca2+-binding EF-hand superfamily protein n=1 Tax=Saccharothrix longispora TaxID=33920 RepID=A0ABU1PUK4_9PSEU|nr:EF-hand domain-containing protein [Saccharothrix longispora]MDR6594327.1 Ca2+-binding EF-hand superfamily protein [Saccharothrix longispora]
MPDQVLHDNIDRVFAILDADGDGGVRKDDFTSMGRGVAREFGLDEDSPRSRRLVEGYEAVWDYLCGADLDVDGVVSPAEFREAHTSGRVTTEVLVEKWESASRQSFEAADADGDGHIDLDGFAGIYRGAGIPDRAVAEAAFGAMDANADGRVDWTELSAHVRGLFTATDDSAKGAHMVSGG